MFISLARLFFVVSMNFQKTSKQIFQCSTFMKWITFYYEIIIIKTTIRIRTILVAVRCAHYTFSKLYIKYFHFCINNFNFFLLYRTRVPIYNGKFVSSTRHNISSKYFYLIYKSFSYQTYNHFYNIIPSWCQESIFFLSPNSVE